MSRSKRGTRSWKLKLSIEKLVGFAPDLFNPGLMSLVEGYTLQASSGIWRKANGTITARYVYRSKDAAMRSVVLTVRNISLVEEAA
ncbi:hypothetical protein LH464_17345 [Neorhizobium sp. T786]|uniref:hypothetical protein n=1 Tax=Pseudorhizobium xiangyangii TaxID=2883104 RepID=UPI001D000238|nr:hypothetical protein [Neorhizobium xiangyangii]MCB5204234.1 hypothetical protein [Neorhizobium xiangyangii]